MPTTPGHIRRVGPYEILETIGQGAMGHVYLARDSRLDRNVAIKTISQAGESDPARKNRFVQEARAASSLNHPNIVTIHDFGTDNGISYIVTELVDGESLRNLMKAGPLPIRRLLDIAVQIADALAAAHAAGIVHRDLKPENIMITHSGRVKLLDFGLAKPVIGEDSERTLDELQTEPGLLVGTVGYMSPEQARGNPVSFSSDQFSFGVILHEMATGHHPLRRDTPMETLIAIANFERAPFTPGPVGLRMLIERCMAKDAARRFANTSEIHDRLVRIRKELPEAPHAKPVKVAWWQKLSPLIIAVALSALLVLVLAGMLVTRDVPPALGDPLAYRFVRLSGSQRAELFPAWSPQDRAIAYSAEQDGVLQIFTRSLQTSVSKQVTRSSDDCLFPFWSSDGSYLYYISKHGRRPALWRVNATAGSPDLVYDDVARAAQSRDGRSLALLRSGSADSKSLWMASGGAEPKRYTQPPFDRSGILASSLLEFSPDGKKLGVFASQFDGSSALWIIPLNSGSPQRAFGNKVAGPLVRSFSWMPDSRRFVYSEGGHLWMGDAAGAEPRRLTNGTGDEEFPAVSLAGTRAVFSSMDVHYDLHNIGIGDPSKAQDWSEPIRGAALAWSPVKPVYVYAAQQDGIPVVRLRSPDAGWERTLVSAKDFAGETASFEDLAFSPNGESVAYRRTTGGAGSIYVSALTGETPLRVASEEGLKSGPTWSEDGSWIAYIIGREGKSKLMKVRVGSSTSGPVLVHEDSGTYPAWSPHLGWIACIRPDEGLNLISADGKQFVQKGSGLWYAIAWTKDGSGIIGLKRDVQGRLLLETLNLWDGSGQVSDLGPAPSAFSYSDRLGVPPIRGFSLDPEGKIATYSSLEVHSSLWLLDGLAVPPAAARKERK